MRGFFAGSTLVQDAPQLAQHTIAPACGECGLYRTCKSPKMPVYGKGQKGVMLVGEAPGEQEDDRGIPFIGKAGQRLRASLQSIGIDIKQDCWVTNACICRPPGNKTPDDVKVDSCRPNLLRAIEELQPKVIVLLGGSACRSLISYSWKENPGPILRWTGFQIPSQRPNAWICPTYHPSYLMRQNSELMDRSFDKHLEAAFQLEDRPWKQVPEWASQVEILLDTKQAVRRIRDFVKAKHTTAVDYEANALKPEYTGFKILSCALSSRKLGTISFLWNEETATAMSDFWFDPKIPKEASNLKYEDRLTRFYYGRRPRGWFWDTMLAAHHLDCRRGITSVKFQAYVLLGVGGYNDHIEPFLQSSKGKKINEAELEIEPSQLLQYGGEDALYEDLVAIEQVKKMRERT